MVVLLLTLMDFTLVRYYGHLRKLKTLALLLLYLYYLSLNIAHNVLKYFKKSYLSYLYYNILIFLKILILFL